MSNEHQLTVLCKVAPCFNYWMVMHYRCSNMCGYAPTYYDLEPGFQCSGATDRRADCVATCSL